MTEAWVFPGQGSQKIGMAETLLSLDGASERFELASNLLGRDLLDICHGNSDQSTPLFDLNDTRNTQPAMFVVESLLIDELKRQGSEAKLVAGHSLGELVALYAAEVFDFSTGLTLLRSRSELMAAAGGGAMTAVLGFDVKQLLSLVQNTEGVVVANDNSSDQIVLSGTPEAVEMVVAQLTCKRSVPLNVSGAFHSPLMKDPAEAFAKEIDKLIFNNAIIPVVSNADPTPETNGALLQKKLKKQMITGVRWRETMALMMTQGINSIIEVGPGKVLSGLAKRSMPGVVIKQISSARDLGIGT
ncbi:ACP S-malonyltransferase [Prochlorococcus marinus]|uniref:Malonyl CoA-acyl carrier protein transacylase n=1 Tax=Prochlorococcus marinus (strain MIT 9211) TaxID=93059 RepID=A9BCZ4_PROM4|nr:ACP S-malonyltransferase [Prochlorococcus marinus]ABX08082.1 Malonyl coenzyme A-acyl carrier protein transacylase [Prochlorococcus marinus str. MIT 9211]